MELIIGPWVFLENLPVSYNELKTSILGTYSSGCHISNIVRLIRHMTRVTVKYDCRDFYKSAKDSLIKVLKVTHCVSQAS